MTQHSFFSKSVFTLLALILFVGIANVQAIETSQVSTPRSTSAAIDNLNAADLEPIRVNRMQKPRPRRDVPAVAGKFLLLNDPSGNYWGDMEDIFIEHDLDYDLVTDPNDLPDLDLCDYDVIWIGEYQTDGWNTAYNANRSSVDDWVADGGALYHGTGTNNFGVKPIHPGGLTYYDSWSVNYGYTVPTQVNCLWFDLLNWDPDTELYGTWFSHTRYDETEISDVAEGGDYQVLIDDVEEGDGSPIVARYAYGNGHVIVSGTTDAAAFHDWWVELSYGDSDPEIFEYLMSLSNVECCDPEALLQQIIDYIDALVAAGDLNSNQASFLLRSLNGAWAALQNDRMNYVIQYLNDFCRRVATMVWWGVLSPAEGAYMCDLKDQIIACLTGEEEEDSFADLLAAVEETMPEIFNLNEAYPNPFNSSTTISFTLPFELQASLSIFDISGRRVASLVEGVQQAGVHSAIFNAENLTSGMYFVVLNAGGKVLTQKVMYVQ